MNVTPNKAARAARAREALTAPHAELQAVLDHWAGALDEAARSGGPVRAVRNLLRAFLADEALPHARAEERMLYRAARRDPGTRLWTAGVAPSPLARNAGLPVDATGRVIVSEFLAVKGTDGVRALGDCAAVPDLAAGNGAVCAPTAQHAYRQARRLAGNISRPRCASSPRPAPYDHIAGSGRERR
jgi:hypothetical protein